MNKVTASDKYTEEVLIAAHNFYLNQQDKKVANSTFGYFTDHPVAPLNKKRLKTIIQKIIEIQKQKKRPLIIADLACGAGLISNALSGIGNNVIGIDLNVKEIILAQQFTKTLGHNTQFLRADLLNGEWKEKAEKTLKGKPDIIILAYALHHLERVDKIIGELSNWLEKGSVLLVNEENTFSPLWRIKHFIRTLIQKDTHLEHHKSFNKWQEILAKNNFRTTFYRGVDPFPPFESLLPNVCWSIVFTATKK